jgi:sugar/nucleoside kinase (ribokinase family)
MRGLFVGMTTLDLIYLAEALPHPNQKVVAIDALTAAGGPATNAAVAFQSLGNQALLLSILGRHPITQLIRADLEPLGLQLCDLAPDSIASPPVSSIIVTQATAERAVISINATRLLADPTGFNWEQLLPIDIVLLDGHQLAMSAVVAAQARAAGIPVVLDGGSWKPGLETILAEVDYAICSANFQPPACASSAEIWDYLSDCGIEHIAITHGEHPIAYLSRGQRGQIPVPSIDAIDTLGAGDIFHGAFCHFVPYLDFTAALEQAARVAARACESFGTRSWIGTSGLV